MSEVYKLKTFNGSPKGPYEDPYVSHGRMAFSFVDLKGNMIGPFVDCKGYVKNRVHGSIIGKAENDYKYAPKMGKVELGETRLLVSQKKYTAKELNKILVLAMDLLNDLEKDLHLVRSTFVPVEYPKADLQEQYGPCFLVKGSKRWMIAPPMLDLYVWLIRSAESHVKGRNYFASIQAITGAKEAGPGSYANMVKWLVQTKYANVFGTDMDKNWPNTVPSHIMHEIGIRYFTDHSNVIEQYFPHWKKVGQATVKKALKTKAA